MKRLKNEKGQAMVEFAIILPILLLLVMGITEFGMMMNSYLSVQNATREGARAGIVGWSNEEVSDRIVNTTPSLRAENMTINITPGDGSRNSGETLRVNIEYDYYLTVPIINRMFNEVITLNAETSMRIE